MRTWRPWLDGSELVLRRLLGPSGEGSYVEVRGESGRLRWSVVVEGQPLQWGLAHTILGAQRAGTAAAWSLARQINPDLARSIDRAEALDRPGSLQAAA